MSTSRSGINTINSSLVFSCNQVLTDVALNQLQSNAISAFQRGETVINHAPERGDGNFFEPYVGYSPRGGDHKNRYNPYISVGFPFENAGYNKFLLQTDFRFQGWSTNFDSGPNASIEVYKVDVRYTWPTGNAIIFSADITGVVSPSGAVSYVPGYTTAGTVITVCLRGNIPSVPTPGSADICGLNLEVHSRPASALTPTTNEKFRMTSNLNEYGGFGAIYFKLYGE